MWTFLPLNAEDSVGADALRETSYFTCDQLVATYLKEDTNDSLAWWVAKVLLDYKAV